ncbi:CDP-diacylglycerol--serine O-phosphatidyltransferase [Veillonella montpellierensis DNF00314]|uniref:CDP-diacylglycerol--serine O-phosphatidyltransferase n=1 Tax=Veillonella montpellierensis DNF00314 TaxID=1401067 RepID=A0A096AML7_9FIRM|nr:CDP-diacylglycerol--serine O-phosphatidyltransferase [Veillonella montpellierensis]KGF47921.1 CDP-diacylglycerol--serine O-phosphatidyltransferase [Veillonella montpellierensis DNF00314]
MNRSIFPCIATSSNLAFGVIGITMSAKGYYEGAAICVLLSLLADALDGRIARALGVAGPLGRELDSLADVVGFGVSPAFLLFSKELFGMGWLSYVPLLAFAVCGAFRLARFNIMTEEVHGYFQGLPIPAAGCMVATYVLCGVSVSPVIVLIAMIVVGYLMVSNVHYPDFKGKSADVMHKIAIGIVVLLFIIGMILNWHAWAVLIFVLYALFGILNTLFNRFK